MTDLKPIAALGGMTPCIEVIGDLTISEISDRALASLAARVGAGPSVAAKMKALTGLDLPEPGALVASDTWSIWWMAPDQWMVDANHASHELLERTVKSAVGSEGSVTEQTDGWCRFDITGPSSEALFERLCPVDLQLMGPQGATRTMIHHLGCFLIRVRGGCAVLGPRSSAGSLHHALVTAARSIA
ncbi:sarcosine oxidase subunit gamma [Shimia sp.]|uniref:sarcosine oxidase subunit gamma n=1 Tax=Shimia sp. TaxID=1954381 RepID=UPI003BAB1955